ncbi:MAG: DUF4760 domain-containing protein [Acidobacteriota bacterium]|nr:DUF4760 domain-containing protein [Acidobacteriota bacterium]
MTLQEFSRDVAPVLSVVVGFMGLASIGLLWHQMKLGTRWNKLQGQANFLNRSIDELEGNLQQALKPVAIEFFHRREPLTPDDVKRLLADENAYLQVKSYLNTFEDIGAAVRIGFVDGDFAYALEGPRLVKAWKIFTPLALHLRDYYSNESIFVELENVAVTWEDRAELEKIEHSDLKRRSRTEIGIARPKV